MAFCQTLPVLVVSFHFIISLLGLLFSWSELLYKLLTKTWFQLLIPVFYPVRLAKKSRITKLFFPDLSDSNNIIKENKHFKVQLSEVKRDVLSVEKARQHQHNMSCVVAQSHLSVFTKLILQVSSHESIQIVTYSSSIILLGIA